MQREATRNLSEPLLESEKVESLPRETRSHTNSADEPLPTGAV